LMLAHLLCPDMIILSFRLENYRTWQMAPKEIKGDFFK
jgi:hypothetical protein